MNWTNVGVAVLAGYLIGAIPIGFLVAKAYGVNILQHGSGRTGGTNVLRALGFGPAALTVLGDALKAVAAPLSSATIGQSFSSSAAAPAACLRPPG